MSPGLTDAPIPVSTAASSPLKDAIDAQSGRFEFFKQVLTLGSVGLAGIAALFTDSARIPTDVVSKGTLAAAGLALLTIVAYAAMGLSDYANLLTALAREAGLISATDKSQKSQKTPSEYSDGIISHARIIIIALFVVWISLTGFAAFRLFAGTVTNTETALATARALVSKETGQPSESLFLTRLETDNNIFKIAYSVQAIQSETSVTISKKDGTVISIVQTRTRTTASPTTSPSAIPSSERGPAPTAVTTPPVSEGWYTGFSVEALGCIGPFDPGEWHAPHLPANRNQEVPCHWIDVRTVSTQLKKLRRSPPSLLLFLGSADKTRMRRGLRSNFGSNQALARARANWVSEEVLNSANFPPGSTPKSLILTVGPGEHGHKLSTDQMENDRSVAVFAFWLRELHEHNTIH